MFTQVQGPLGEVKPLRPAWVYCTAWRVHSTRELRELEVAANGYLRWKKSLVSPLDGGWRMIRLGPPWHEGPGHLIKRCPGYSEETQTTVAILLCPGRTLPPCLCTVPPYRPGQRYGGDISRRTCGAGGSVTKAEKPPSKLGGGWRCRGPWGKIGRAHV